MGICLAFLEDIIGACVMKSYFREHMASRQLSGFHATVAEHLASSATPPPAPNSSPSSNRKAARDRNRRRADNPVNAVTKCPILFQSSK